MVSGPNLQQQVSQKVQEIKQAVSGLSDEKASERAEGGWCAKEVLSHLIGDGNMVGRFNQILQEETPALDVIPGQSAYDAERERTPVSDLLASVESQYSELGTFLGGLSEVQLSRKAHVPYLKDSPLGEYPTLGQFAMGIINFHLNDHIQQLCTLAQK